MNMPIPPAPQSFQDPTTQVIEDLAVLCDGPSVNLHVAFDGALLDMFSHDRQVWSESAEARWMRLDGRDRAMMLLDWFHRAAREYRARLARHGRPAQNVA
jgi:hypothetical protein